MLSIGKLILGQQRYYEQQVAQGGDDYYTGRGEAPGEWAGAGARELGLQGRVSAAQFNALLAGLDPRDSAAWLRARISEPKVAALDLTFSAPKSVSVLFAVAPADVSAALVDAHEEAVAVALEWLEEDAVFVRRGAGGHRFERGGGLIAAAYRHRMSRSLDPQLHTHVVAANLSRGEDGRHTALHHPSLYRAAKTAGYLYQSHLRAAVRERLGLEWGPVHKGAAELRELPVEVLRVFSQRRAQVEAAVAEKELEIGRPLTRAERSTWGAVATRDRKAYGIDTHTWREEIAARAAEHGLDQDVIEQTAARGADRVAHHDLPDDGELGLLGVATGEREFGDLLAGPSGLTDRANTFNEPSVLREFAAAAEQGARVDTVRDQSARFVSRADVLAIGRGTLTSTNLVDVERALIVGATNRADTGVAILNEQTVVTAVASGRPLNAGQAEAVRAVATSGNGIDVIEALAGTGKTYTAGALRDLYQQHGYTVLGVAPTARAARELTEQAGIPSRTLDSRLLAIDTGSALPERSVVIFDEAGMASTRQSERFLAHAALVGAKVIAIGDSGQLPSVQAGGWLRAIGVRLGAVRLTEVVRQRDPAERLALAGLHDGDPRRWLDWATRAGRVEVLPDSHEILERAVRDWAGGVRWHGVEQSVLIARDNDTRRTLNDLAREHRREDGRLGEDRQYGSESIAVGDRVICRNNERDLDVDNGTRGTVRHADGGGIVIETDAHLIRELPAGYVAEHVEHAYALTGHGMQGATVEHATVVASPDDLSRGWAYTALSRARGQTRVLIRDSAPDGVDREEHGPTARTAVCDRTVVLARVERRMLERDDQDLAIDQLAASPETVVPSLARAQVIDAPQEQTAERAEPPVSQSAQTAFKDTQQLLEQLRTQLRALPSVQLAQLDDLDTRVRMLTMRRDLTRGELERLPAPTKRRFARGEDLHLVARTRLSSALGGVERQLEHAVTQRVTLARQLGQPEAIRDERESLNDLANTLQREHSRLRDELAEHELATQPEWAREALGERPESGWDRERWDNAARTIALYRIEYDVRDVSDALGPRPTDQAHRLDYETAQRARHEFARELGRETAGYDLGMG